MAAFTKRRGGYRFGLMLFVLGVAAFVAGFATPHWTKFHVSRQHQQHLELEGHAGLWTYCVKAVDVEPLCQGTESSVDWQTAVKAVQCTAVGVMGLCLFFLLLTDCVLKDPTFTRLLEIGTGIAGLLGLSGAGIYMWKSQSDKNMMDSLQVVNTSLGWSSYANIGGSAVILVATLVITIFNYPIKSKPKPRRATTTTTAATGPSAPFPTLTRNTPAAATVQGYASGSNPYVVSAAMADYTPAMYPSLEDLH